MQIANTMNFLIAEDSVPMRRMIRDLIAPASGEIYECADGAEALAAYVKYQPDWVLMDIKMPKMDGITATRAIRAVNPQAKIIIVTSYDDPLLHTEAEEAGALAYVVKDNLSRLRNVMRDGRTK